MVITSDFDSDNLGSNPGRTYYYILYLKSLNIKSFIKSFLYFCNPYTIHNSSRRICNFCNMFPM